jgi:hypothetical protein
MEVLVGKSSINGPFSMAMLNNQTVSHSDHPCMGLLGLWTSFEQSLDQEKNECTKEIPMATGTWCRKIQSQPLSFKLLLYMSMISAILHQPKITQGVHRQEPPAASSLHVHATKFQKLASWVRTRGQNGVTNYLVDDNLSNSKFH